MTQVYRNSKARPSAPVEPAMAPVWFPNSSCLYGGNMSDNHNYKVQIFVFHVNK